MSREPRELRVPAGPSPGLPGWGCRSTPPDEADQRADQLLGRAGGYDPGDPRSRAEERPQALSEVFETRLRVVQDALRRCGDDGALAALESALEAKILEQELADRKSVV